MRDSARCYCVRGNRRTHSPAQVASRCINWTFRFSGGFWDLKSFTLGGLHGFTWYFGGVIIKFIMVANFDTIIPSHTYQNSSFWWSLMVLGNNMQQPVLETTSSILQQSLMASQGWSSYRVDPNFDWAKPGDPLVNSHITMENHHFSWENPLFLWPFSIAFCMFTRGYHPLALSSPGHQIGRQMRCVWIM